MKRLLKGGRVVDPSQGLDAIADVLIDDGRVAAIGGGHAGDDVEIVEVPAGCVICPGFLDMHVHLREPGQEHKETIATGTAAAAAGGFTAVACMPNTDPVNDSASVTQAILRTAAAEGLVRVYPIGAVTRGMKGEQLAEIADLRAAGCVAVSDDGRPVPSALIMRRALEYAGMLDLPVIDHCEEPSLKGEGTAHEGYMASVLGLRGIPAAAESIMVERDIALAEMTGGAVHIAHLSTRQAIRAVRAARARGVRVTCEVTPHHFTLTDARLADPIPYDTNLKMNPPLREQADVDALIEGLRDGTVDAIATDHAPHQADEKHVEFDKAPFGVIGLETAVALALDRLVRSGGITLGRLVELLSCNPARILRVAGGSLATGQPADITVIAPGASTTIDVTRSRSKSRNSPFHGWTLTGAVAATIVGGRTVYVNGAVSGASVFGTGARA
ncbi:MAG TPA: dihydroorotase [Vicinamibacterales bacterium]|nr:dihydroorotase [Vicinamibacterales bacterium]